MKAQNISKVWRSAEKCEKCAIRNMVLFADLTREDFDLIHQPIQDYEVRVGELLYDVSTPPEYVYTIRSGLVKLVSYLPDGGYRIVRILKQGDVVGMEALSDNNYLQEAVVLEVASVCRIPVSLVKKLNENSPHLSKQLMTRWQNVMTDADIWLSKLSVGFSKQRVASLLLHLADGNGESCYLPSREDMGAILSMTTETASRVVADFKRNKWVVPISPNRARLNIEALSELVETVDGVS